MKKLSGMRDRNSLMFKSSLLLTEVCANRKRCGGLSQENPWGRRRVWLVTWAESQAWMSCEESWFRSAHG